MLQRERVKTLDEMAEKSRYFYQAPLLDKQSISDDMVAVLSLLKERFRELSVWSDKSIHTVLLETASELSLKLGKVAQPLRWVITGSNISPPMNATLRLLGKKEVLARIQCALD